MIFTPLSIPGAMLIEHEPFSDHRGQFWRAWDADEMAAHGIPPTVQSNVSINSHAMTLRGFHAQRHPHEEAKTLTCLQGWADDVIVDLRPDSETYLKHERVLLRPGRSVHVPKGAANAFLTREANTIFHYCCSEAYHPESEYGIRYDDPALGIEWFGRPVVISDKDRSHPDWHE